MEDYDLERRVEKIQNMDYNQALDIIYMWVKQDVINKKQFKHLIKKIEVQQYKKFEQQ
jgi:hypothetical protein